METEVRIFPIELREVQAVGKPYRYIEGRAVPYNTWQDIGPFWENHAERSFERSTKGNAGQKLPLLLGHDRTDLDSLIGHAERWEHDQTGMYGVWRLNEQPRAQQAARLAESGDLNGMSVGFLEVHATPIRKPRNVDGPSSVDKPWIMRTESRLLEVSLLSTPAFPDAGVINVRSAVDPDSVFLPPIPTPDLDEWRQRRAALS